MEQVTNCQHQSAFCGVVWCSVVQGAYMEQVMASNVVRGAYVEQVTASISQPAVVWRGGVMWCEGPTWNR